jgi:hypothetical protein
MIGSFNVRKPPLLNEARTMGQTAGRSQNSRPVAVRQPLSSSILRYFQVRQGLPVSRNASRNDLHPRLFGR